MLYYIYVVDAMSTLFLFGKQDILISTPTQLLGVGGEQEWLKGIPLFKTFHKKDQTVHGFPIPQEPIQRLKFSLINAKKPTKIL